MFGRRVANQWVRMLAIPCLVVVRASAAAAQPPDQHPSEHIAGEMQMSMPAQPQDRQGSGTAWLPDDTPMYALHSTQGPWALMGHGSVFLQYLYESGDRGDNQLGSVNWLMGMARRDAGRGRLTLRSMLSLEPWTIRGCGYPDLLASGEQCGGEQIHDHQHPHDLFMELSALYDAPLAGALRWQIYGGPAGEPAIGPVAFTHRPSGQANPVAPISHHWLDSTHVSFGVVTGGVYTARWKVEGSIFNGREPDEHRTDFDFGALDSFAGRAWFTPTSQWALQVSAAKLTGAEQAEGASPRIDVTRVTGSATYHRLLGVAGLSATTIAWGHNTESGHGSNALLAETSLTLHDRDVWFGRFEAVGKTAHDLGVSESLDTFAVAKLQGGYTRYLKAWKGLQPGAGAAISAAFVPQSLEPYYGRRVNPGAAIFLTLRPAAMPMMMMQMGK